MMDRIEINPVPAKNNKTKRLTSAKRRIDPNGDDASREKRVLKANPSHSLVSSQHKTVCITSFGRQLSLDSDSDSDEQSVIFAKPPTESQQENLVVPRGECIRQPDAEIAPCPLVGLETKKVTPTTPICLEQDAKNTSIAKVNTKEGSVKPENVRVVSDKIGQKSIPMPFSRPRFNFVRNLVVLVLLLAAAWLSSSDRWSNAAVDPNSVYVPGAGFSGFWFTLGRLQSIPNPKEKSYYCFSAGCLGVVASLSNHSITDVVGMALHIQQEWKAGHSERFSVTSSFASALVEAPRSNCTLLDSACSATLFQNVSRPMDDPELLSRINIITTVKNGWFGWKTQIRSPRNIDELKEMLVQTTWIPFATGSSLWHKDSQTGQYHMDGGVTAIFHPRCKHFLGLPLYMPGLFLNFLNVNLGLEQAVAFWNAGVSMGL